MVDLNVKYPVEKEKSALNSFKKFLFYFVQWTWGLPVNLFGGIVFLIATKILHRRYQRFGYAFITYLPWNSGGLSLGLFIFIKDQHPSKRWTYNTRIHEYGHTWQCLILGPFYWFVVGIPSAFWCNVLGSFRAKRKISYYKLYCEYWANLWGQRFTGLPLVLKGIDEKYC